MHLARDLCLRISQKAAVKMSCGSSVISRLVGGKSACVLTRVAPSSQRSSIAVSKKYSFLATWASPSYSPQGAGASLETNGEGARASPRGEQCLCLRASEVTCYLLGHILSFRSEAGVPDSNPVVEYGTQNDVYPRRESLETLKGCPPCFGGTLPQLAIPIILASKLERDLGENFVKPFWDPYSSLPRSSLHKGRVPVWLSQVNV